TEAEQIAVLQKEGKRRREALSMYQQAGRSDKVAVEQAELDELAHFLPKPMSDEQLMLVVEQTVTELQAGPGDFGKVMGAVMKKVQGQADGNRVSAAVKNILK